MCTPRSLFSVSRRLIEGYAGGYKSRFMLWRLEDSLLKLTLGDSGLVTRDRIKAERNFWDEHRKDSKCCPPSQFNLSDFNC